MNNDDPLGFLITWSTYGTWLPGDERGWVEYRGGLQLPDPVLELECSARMTEEACILRPDQREIVQNQVRETCEFKRWTLHAVNCRTNHLHVVLTASIDPKVIREQLKALCSRRLNEQQRKVASAVEQDREKWWADRGSIRWLHTEASLQAAILYVRDEQDNPRRFLK